MMSPNDIATVVGAIGVGVTLTEAQRRRVSGVLREAIALSKQTMLRASQEAEINQAQFTRQIDLIDGSLKRLAMQPDAFWQWLAVAIAREFGMPSEAKRAARLALATVGLKRMARANLPASSSAKQGVM